MLVLSRSAGEKIKIGSNIEVQVLKIEKGRVKLGFSAPESVSINRLELHNKLQENKLKKLEKNDKS